MLLQGVPRVPSESATLLMILFLMCCARTNSYVNISTLIPENYDIAVAPSPDDGSPISIGVSWRINGIFEVNIHEMTILMAVYFRMKWTEARLTPPEDLTSDTNHVLPLHLSILKRVWVPDLFIHEAIDITTFKMIGDVQGVFLLGNDTILLSSMLQTRLACPMFFSKYPFDVQTCVMSVSSYNFGNDKLLLEWMSDGVTSESDVSHQVPNYKFDIKATDVGNKIWCVNCSFAPASVKSAKLIFERRYTGHLLTVYFPSGLVVSLAWVSFFWPADAIPGRTVLIITSLLTIISMYGSVGQQSPETSYPKAVDVWLFLCMFHVVLALFQYAMIIMIKRKQISNSSTPNFVKTSALSCTKRENNHPSRCENTVHPRETSSRQSHVMQPAVTLEDSGAEAYLLLELKEYRVEKAGKWGLPLLFLFCSVIYWPYYV